MLGLTKRVLLSLPSELAVDLHVFCDLHFGSSRTRVICEAVDQFIKTERQGSKSFDDAFVQARSTFVGQMASEERSQGLRLVAPAVKALARNQKKRSDKA